MPARLIVALLLLWCSLPLVFLWRISREVFERTGFVTISTLTLALWLYRLVLFFMLLICAVLSLLRILLLRAVLFRIGELPRLIGFLKVTCSSWPSLLISSVLLDVDIFLVKLLDPNVFLLEARFGCEGLLCCTLALLIESVFCLTRVLFVTVEVLLLELVVLELAIFGA